jgi:hypothetical protein
VEIYYNSSIIDKAGISKVNKDDDINTSERSKIKRHDDINTPERTLSDNTAQLSLVYLYPVDHALNESNILI